MVLKLTSHGLPVGKETTFVARETGKKISQVGCNQKLKTDIRTSESSESSERAEREFTV